MAGFARTDPKRFAQLYHAIAWSLGTDIYKVEVRKYLSLNPGVCDPKRIDGVQKAKSFLLRDLQKDKQAIREGNWYRIQAHDRHVSLTAIDNSFAGRATPDELKQTLWLATYQGHIVPTVTTRKPETSTAKDFADWYLGMDCTGFVQAFLGFAAPRSIGSYDKNPSSRRQTAKDVLSCDIMIVKNKDGEYKHIAVVASKAIQPPDTMIVHTAEASGEHMEGNWMQGVVDDKKRKLKLQSPGVFVSADKPGAGFYFYPMP